MTENSYLNHIESQIKSEYLSVPSKSILLEEGKIAEKLYLIRKGCLRLFFYNEGKDITFQFFFEGDFVASFDSLYKRTPSLFYLERKGTLKNPYPESGLYPNIMSGNYNVNWMGLL